MEWAVVNVSVEKNNVMILNREANVGFQVWNKALERLIGWT